MPQSDDDTLDSETLAMMSDTWPFSPFCAGPEVEVLIHNTVTKLVASIYHYQSEEVTRGTPLSNGHMTGLYKTVLGLACSNELEIPFPISKVANIDTVGQLIDFLNRQYEEGYESEPAEDITDLLNE